MSLFLTLFLEGCMPDCCMVYFININSDILDELNRHCAEMADCISSCGDFLG